MPSGPGAGLSAAEVGRWQPLVPVDLSAVRVHEGPAADAAAQAQGALALAAGADVVLSRRLPERAAGLAHELVHVAQQAAPGPGPGRAEVEARAGEGAERLLQGRPLGPVGAAAAGVWPLDDPSLGYDPDDRRFLEHVLAHGPRYYVASHLDRLSDAELHALARDWDGDLSLALANVLTAEEWGRIEARLGADVSVAAELARAGGILHADTAAVDDAIDRMDRAALLAMAADDRALVDLIGDSPLLGNDEALYRARRRIAARLEGFAPQPGAGAEASGAAAGAEASGAAAELRLRAAVERIRGALWLGPRWANVADVYLALTELDAPGRARAFAAVADLLGTGSLYDEVSRICAEADDARAVALATALATQAGGGSPDLVAVASEAHAARGPAIGAGLEPRPADASLARKLLSTTTAAAALQQLEQAAAASRAEALRDLGVQAHLMLLLEAAPAAEAAALRAYVHPSAPEAVSRPDVIARVGEALPRALRRGDARAVLSLLESLRLGEPLAVGALPEVAAALDDPAVPDDLAAQAALVVEDGRPVDRDWFAAYAEGVVFDDGAMLGEALAGDALSTALRRRAYAGGEALDPRIGRLSARERVVAEDVVLGQPDPLASDPALEAAFARRRLQARRAAVGADLGLAGAFGWSWSQAAEALGAFDAAWAQANGRWTPAALAVLVDAYFRAIDALDAYAAEREVVAGYGRTVAAVVASLAVVGATGGAATPAVLALSAGLGGAAAAAAGIAVRGLGSEPLTVGIDFAQGAVDGALNVVGDGLAASVLRARVGQGLLGDAVLASLPPTWGPRVVRAAEASLSGALGGAGGDVFATALDRETWERDRRAVLARFLAAAARGAFAGGLTGAAFESAAQLTRAVGAGRARTVEAAAARASQPSAPLDVEIVALSRAERALLDIGDGDVAIRLDPDGTVRDVVRTPGASQLEVDVHVAVAGQLQSWVYSLLLWFQRVDHRLREGALGGAQLDRALTELYKHDQLLDAYLLELSSAPLRADEVAAILERVEALDAWKAHWEAVLRGEAEPDTFDPSIIFGRRRRRAGRERATVWSRPSGPSEVPEGGAPPGHMVQEGRLQPIEWVSVRLQFRSLGDRVVVDNLDQVLATNVLGRPVERVPETLTRLGYVERNGELLVDPTAAEYAGYMVPLHIDDAGLVALRGVEAPRRRWPNENFVDQVPFGFNQRQFADFAREARARFEAAGYGDASFYMQGSSVSRIKYTTGQAIDPEAGVVSQDYDVAVVSAQLLARAAELDLNVLSGPLRAEQVSALGLEEAQDTLTELTAVQRPVNFQVYNTQADVFAAKLTTPFAAFED